MAAAPELADGLRDIVNYFSGQWNSEIMEKKIMRYGDRLRELGIPNAAPLYKGDSNES